MNRYTFTSGEEMNNHLCYECHRLKCRCAQKKKLDMLQAFANSQPINFAGKRIDVQKYLDEAMKEDE